MKGHRLSRLKNTFEFSGPAHIANTALNILERRLGRTALRSYPPVVQVEVTNRCNLKCFMCSRSTFPFKGRDLDPELIPIVVELSKRSRELVLFGYGEGLIADAFYDLLGQTKSASISFVTNGLVLDGETFDRILQLSRRPLSTVSFSIDAVRNDVYSSIRKGSDFSRVWANLLGVISRKKEKNLRFPRVWIDFVAMARSVQDLPALVEMAARADVDRVNVFNLVVWDSSYADENLLYHRELASQAFAAACKTAEKHDICLDLPVVPSVGPGNPTGNLCFEPWRYAYVRRDGTIQACCFADEFTMGNIKRTAFADIWNNEAYKRLRATVNTSPPSACQRCENRFRLVNSLNDEFVYLKNGPRAFVKGK